MTLASILSDPKASRAYMEFLAPDPLADGHEPEDRLVQCGMSWERYLAFDEQATEPRRSRLLPDLDTGLLERCVAIRSWQEARRAFRAGLKPGI